MVETVGSTVYKLSMIKIVLYYTTFTFVLEHLNGPLQKEDDVTYQNIIINEQNLPVTLSRPYTQFSNI